MDTGFIEQANKAKSVQLACCSARSLKCRNWGRSKESRLQLSPASHRCRGSRVNGKARNASRADEHFYGGPSTCPLWSQRGTIPVSRQNTISSFAQENLGKSPLQR